MACTSTCSSVANSAVRRYFCFVDALVEAREAYGDLVEQLFYGEEKRTDFFHSLIALLYLQSDQVRSG